MKNTFSSPFNLPPISDLKSKQEKKAINLIKHLSVTDALDDECFKTFKKQIKQLIQIAPIVFEKPKFLDYEFVERTLSVTQQKNGMSENNYIHKVSFSYVGDSLLLNYKPLSMSWLSSEHGLINGFGKSFTVYVELPELNPEKSIVAAKDFMSMTLMMVGDNNTEITSWNEHISAGIDQKMDLKREELLQATTGSSAVDPIPLSRPGKKE